MNFTDRLKALFKLGKIPSVTLQQTRIEHDASACGRDCVLCQEIRQAFGEFLKEFQGMLHTGGRDG